jgi:hypothetical protein
MGTYGSWSYYEPNMPGFKADMLHFNGNLPNFLGTGYCSKFEFNFKNEK